MLLYSYSSDTMQVNELWNHVMRVGYTVRKNNCNGLYMWQPLKELYSKYEIEGYPKGVKVNDRISKLSREVRYTSKDKAHENVTIMINSTQLENSAEAEHFIIQHFRIPITQEYKLQLVKVLQIAYNVGQAKAEFERGSAYNSEIESFYKKNRLGELSTFVLEEIGKGTIVQREPIGGNLNYYYKYMNYKTKYIASKS
jgi:hypothetical protein